MFDDRLQAARALVPALRERIDEPPVVLAIPRGGVPREFGQVSDAEVEQQLREAAARGSGSE